MTATNHVVTGAVLAAAIPHPIVLPLAFVSHFVLDALPHFDEQNHAGRRFQYILLADAAVAASFLMTLFLLHLPHWQLMAGAGILAASPDLMWLPAFTRELLKRPPKPAPKYLAIRLHSVVQRYTSLTYWVFELGWLSIMLTLFGWLSTRLLFRI